MSEQAPDLAVRLGLRARIAKVMPYFRGVGPIWLMVICGAFVGAATEPMIPALLKPLLDRGFQQGALEIWTIPASLLLLFGVRGLAGYIAQVGLTKITNHGLLNLRKAMFAKLLTSDIQLFSAQSSSALSNTLVYEVQNGSSMLVASFLSLTRNSLTLIALSGYLLYLNWKLTLIVVTVFPAVAWVMQVLTKRLHRLTRASQDATDELAYVVEENVLAHRDIRLHNAQDSQAQRFDQLSEKLGRLALKSTVAGAAMTPVTQMLAAVALSAVISVALIQSATSGTSVGGFVAFVTAMLMIIAPIRQLSEVSSPITKGLAALERALRLIEDTPDENEGSYSPARASGEIRFSEVSVSYDPRKPDAVKHFSLDIKPGETLALVGTSGSGKTTVANLLPRFVKPSEGDILLDGIDIQSWSLKSLRSQIAVVSQHVMMVNDTLAANVCLGSSPDRQRIQHCLDMANLHEFVTSLELGMDTLVGHNAMQLSGGQRQRLAIARALYKDAPILILDEATSALDTDSERLVQESLAKLVKNRTTLVIAHRLSTIRHADRIVVMASGAIVETGTHDELMNRNGLYTRLHQTGMSASKQTAAKPLQEETL